MDESELGNMVMAGGGRILHRLAWGVARGRPITRDPVVERTRMGVATDKNKQKKKPM